MIARGVRFHQSDHICRGNIPEPAIINSKADNLTDQDIMISGGVNGVEAQSNRLSVH